MRSRAAVRALILAVALIHCLPIAAREAAAADYKIGYIDSERVFREYTGTKSAETQFNQDLEGWVRQFEGQKADIEKLEKEFEAQRLMLSDARRKEKEDELQARYGELAQLEREIWGPTGKAAQRNEQLTRDIVGRIREAALRIASAEGYDLVLDAADGNLIYGNPALDLTDRIVTELNEAAGSDAPR
jgi:outer membrane protein